MALLIHHAANRDHVHPPGSLSALSACLEAGARVVELDVTPLANGDYALLHDSLLEEATDGRGPVGQATAEGIKRLRYTQGGKLSEEPVGLLSEAVECARAYRALDELQLDLKADAPLSESALASLVRLVEPLGPRVRVSSCADWALRRLRRISPLLALGFDPQFYLDVETGEEGQRLPFRHGPYGYRDDHPATLYRWPSAAGYLAARLEALLAQLPSGLVWYVRASCVARVLADGCDWVTLLQQQGCQVAAWTLNPDRPGELALAGRLVDAGVDRITTDAAPRLAMALGRGTAC